MAPTFGSAYAGGYSEVTRRRLQNVTIPEKIKCGTCKKIRSPISYSNKQLEILRHAILSHGEEVALSGIDIRCRICSTSQIVELKCSTCDQVKGLDEFAKSQRQDRDIARCMNCVQNHTETEPVAEELKFHQTDTNPSTVQDTRTLNPYDEHSLVDSTKRRNKAVPLAGYLGLGQREEDDDDASVAGGVSIDPALGDGENTKGKAHASTAYKSQEVAHPRAASPLETPKSVHSGWTSWGINPDTIRQTANPTSPSPTKKPSRFPKVPSKRFEKHEAPTMRIPEPTGQALSSDEEEGGTGGIEGYL